jgi:hypothetical protein
MYVHIVNSSDIDGVNKFTTSSENDDIPIRELKVTKYNDISTLLVSCIISSEVSATELANDMLAGLTFVMLPKDQNDHLAGVSYCSSKMPVEHFCKKVPLPTLGC